MSCCARGTPAAARWPARRTIGSSAAAARSAAGASACCQTTRVFSAGGAERRRREQRTKEAHSRRGRRAAVAVVAVRVGVELREYALHDRGHTAHVRALRRSLAVCLEEAAVWMLLGRAVPVLRARRTFSGGARRRISSRICTHHVKAPQPCAAVHLAQHAAAVGVVPPRFGTMSEPEQSAPALDALAHGAGSGSAPRSALAPDSAAASRTAARRSISPQRGGRSCSACRGGSGLAATMVGGERLATQLGTQAFERSKAAAAPGKHGPLM